MLRAIVVLLFLANVGYLAWSQGWMRDWGWAPASGTEPQRLPEQLVPQSLRVLSGDEIKQVEATRKDKTVAGQCLVAGPFDAARSELVHEQLSGLLPAQSWVVESSIEPDGKLVSRWLVYMGPYSTTDALAKKQTELRALGTKFEVLQPACAPPGISLGSFASRGEAERRLQGLPKGIRTARVVAQQAAASCQMFRVPAADADMRTALEDLAARVPVVGSFRPC